MALPSCVGNPAKGFSIKRGAGETKERKNQRKKDVMISSHQHQFVNTLPLFYTRTHTHTHQLQIYCFTSSQSLPCLKTLISIYSVA